MKPYPIISVRYEDGGDHGGDCEAIRFNVEYIGGDDQKSAIAKFASKWLNEYPAAILPKCWIGEPSDEKVIVQDYELPVNEDGDLEIDLETIDLTPRIPAGFRDVKAEDIPMEFLAISDSNFVEGYWMVTFPLYYPEILDIIGPSVQAIRDCALMAEANPDPDVRMGDYLAAMTGDYSEYDDGPGEIGTYHPSETANPYPDVEGLKSLVAPTESTEKHRVAIENGWKWRYTCRHGGLDGKPSRFIDPRPFV